MATMRDIVTGAAKRLRMIGPADSLEAEDASDMLQALNDMLGSWVAMGVNINWGDDLGLSATVPLDAKHNAGLKAMLAQRYAEDTGKAITPQLARDADDGWHAINADYRLPEQMSCDSALTSMPLQRRHWG